MRKPYESKFERATTILRFALAGLAAQATVACGALVDDSESGQGALRLSNPPGLTMTVCGRVTGYDAPRDGLLGELRLDRGAWALLPEAAVANETLLRVDSRVCVHAALDLDQRIQGAFISQADDPRADTLGEAMNPLPPALTDNDLGVTGDEETTGAP